MLISVTANMPSFRAVSFSEHFNVILADRTTVSTDRDSRNGLGKTTLVEIIHFCLGSQPRPNRGLRVAPLAGWEFTLALKIRNRHLAVTRSTDSPGRVSVRGDIAGLTSSADQSHEVLDLRANDWTALLGDLCFDLSSQELRPKYNPTFRSLFSYFVRRGRDAFASPFSQHPQQRIWDKQVNNAFLLGLTWQHAAELQEIKDEENLLNAIRRAAQADLLAGMVGTLGILEAERARLDSEIRAQSEALETFRVHPQYNELEEQANDLTTLIHDLSNSNLRDGRLIDLYNSSLAETGDLDFADVSAVYREAMVTLPDLVRRRLDEVENFHTQIVENRHAYLQSEIRKLERARSERTIQLNEAIERRSKLFDVLKTHGALQEYTQLHELHLDTVAKRNDIDNRIENLNRFEQGRSDLRVRRELLLQSARREFDERRELRDEAINLFNSNSQALYNSPGHLILDIEDSGFNFDVNIVRSESSGINNMKIFCYDVMLAQFWSSKGRLEIPLMHDSTIFDGVDERQVAEALELAQRESEEHGFQYICALNTDKVPSLEFSPNFDLGQFEILHLTDESEEGGLLGIRY